MNTNDRRMLGHAVLAALTVVTGSAGAQTLYGGGATLPAPGYVGPANAISPDRLTPPDAIPVTALFGAYSLVTSNSPQVQYCQTGSGVGKSVLEGGAGFAADNPCPSFLVTNPMGFEAPSGQLFPDFIASDSPLAATDITNFYDNASVSARVAPVQVPAIAAEIAIVYNNTSITGTPNITTSDLCRVLSGEATQWSDLNLPAPPGTSAIQVVFRSDGSGTTFNLSNHLAAVCPSATGFWTSQNWTGTPSNSVIGLISPAPTNQVGASGNPGVVTKVNTTIGAIGYAEYADALALGGIPHFTVDMKDPTDVVLPTTLSFTTGQVISATAGPTPGLEAVSTQDTHPECLLLVDPRSYANITDGYSIIAVTYLLGYNAGNGDNASAVSSLLSAPYNSEIQSDATDIAPNLGYQFLAADPTTIVKGCINK